MDKRYYSIIITNVNLLILLSLVSMGQYNHKNNYLYSKNYKQMGLVYSVRA